MSSGHYSLQDSHFFRNSSSSEWVLVRGMTATWVVLITCSRIISNRQYIPCSLYQTCLVRDNGLLKLCMHTDETLTLLDTVMERLGQRLRHFQLKTCAAFNTQELKREAECCQHHAQENLKNLQGNSTVMAAASTPHVSRRLKTFNLQTYKLHALSNYLSSIRRYGTTDSYSTEPASNNHASGISSITYMENRESLNTALPKQDFIELMGSNLWNRWPVLSVARPRYSIFATWTIHCPLVPTLKKRLLLLQMLIFISVNLRTFRKISWCSWASTLKTQLSK